MGIVMSIFELLILSVGLSMDAFAVAVCKGLSMDKITIKKVCIIGLWFGVFQAVMPLIGCFLGSTFESYITKYDHWIAFILLGFIGISMIKEAFSKDEETADNSLSFKTMLILAVATSIDALAVGITFAFFIESIGYLIFAVSAIGIMTFLLSALGVKIGNVFGDKYKLGAELAGGIILIFLGIKILLEHLGIINF